MTKPLYEIRDGVIYQDYYSNSLEVEDTNYNPEHYLVFDSKEFVNSVEFTEYIKNIIKKFYTGRHCPVLKIKSNISKNSFDIFRFEFGNILLILKIPEKSDILNIRRERLFYSIFLDNKPFDVEQVITRFEHLKSTLRGLL